MQPRIVLQGDILSTTTQTIRAQLDTELSNMDLANGVEIDVSSASMVDAAGLKVLVSAIKRVRAPGWISTTHHRESERGTNARENGIRLVSQHLHQTGLIAGQ